MIYQYKYVLDSDADIIVVPARGDGALYDSNSTHAWLTGELPVDFATRWHNACVTGYRSSWEPMIYYTETGTWAGRWVITVPVVPGSPLRVISDGIAKVLEMCNGLQIRDVAVPQDWPGMHVDTMEFLWAYHEPDYPKVEVIVCTENDMWLPGKDKKVVSMEVVEDEETLIEMAGDWGEG